MNKELLGEIATIIAANEGVPMIKRHIDAAHSILAAVGGEGVELFTEDHGKALRSITPGEVLTAEQWESVCAFVREQESIIDAYKEREETTPQSVPVDGEVWLEIHDTPYGRGHSFSDAVMNTLPVGRYYLTTPPPASQEMGGAALIAAERERQIAVEGWTPEHDDEHDDGELAKAAACYATPFADRSLDYFKGSVPASWPWESKWWKPVPSDRVRELVKAGALIAAEIDRLQRAAPPSSAAEHRLEMFTKSPGLHEAGCPLSGTPNLYASCDCGLGAAEQASSAAEECRDPVCAVWGDASCKCAAEQAKPGVMHQAVTDLVKALSEPPEDDDPNAPWNVAEQVQAGGRSMKLLLLGTLLILTGCISGHVTPVQMETANKACSSYGGTQQIEATGNQATWVKVQCVDGSIHHVWVKE